MIKISGINTQRFGENSRLKRALWIAGIVGATMGLSACSNNGLSLTGFSGVRTQGYEISESALQQIRPGQSEDLVRAVLGSPQTQGTFDDETAFYYVQTRVEEFKFGLRTEQSRTVLAVYFDKDKKVTDKAIYELQDGRLFAIETRRTASFGQDRTFVEQILASFGG